MVQFAKRGVQELRPMAETSSAAHAARGLAEAVFIFDRMLNKESERGIYISRVSTCWKEDCLMW